MPEADTLKKIRQEIDYNPGESALHDPQETLRPAYIGREGYQKADIPNHQAQPRRRRHYPPKPPGRFSALAAAPCWRARRGSR